MRSDADLDSVPLQSTVCSASGISPFDVALSAARVMADCGIGADYGATVHLVIHRLYLRRDRKAWVETSAQMTRSYIGCIPARCRPTMVEASTRLSILHASL